MLPSPTLASPAPGRLFPAASGNPSRGCCCRQRPPLMLALLAPHTARSSRALCARRPFAGEWSCGCTWCPTQGRCPTRSGSACPQDCGLGYGVGGSPCIPPVEPFAWGSVRSLSLNGCQEACLSCSSPVTLHCVGPLATTSLPEPF
jgi:hypothetical protein